jgi:HEAT repeat protein
MGAEVEKLFEQLEDQDSVVRGRAAERLGEIGGAGVADALARLVEDPDVIVRFKAGVALAYRGDARGLEALLWALSRTELCFAALQALTRLGSPESLPAVRRFFKRVFLHRLERMQAAAVLHRCGDQEGTEFLREKLDSKRPEERGFALELWGRLKMPGAYDLLVKVLEDPDDPHHLDAARGLGHLGDARGLEILERLSGQKRDAELAAVARESAEVIRGGD